MKAGRTMSPMMQALPNSGARLRKSGEKYKHNVGTADPAFREVLALTGKDTTAICVRCKYDIEICPSLRTCVFDSNVFIAGKERQELPCRLCLHAHEARHEAVPRAVCRHVRAPGACPTR